MPISWELDRSWNSIVEHHRRLSRPAREVLAYFLRNPTAADSLEGIARWRLLEEAIHRKVLETQAALEWLVREGLILESIDFPTCRLFRLNPERVEQAAVLLKEAGELDADEVGQS